VIAFARTGQLTGEPATPPPVEVAGDAPRMARGDTIGRYVIVDVLGAGGMGVVYAAYDPRLDRKVALKLLVGGSQQSAELRERLLREAQAMAKLAHPNVIKVYDVGTDGGVPYVAMELIDGGTLSSWLRARRRRWREIVDVLVRAGRGLSAAHQVGL